MKKCLPIFDFSIMNKKFSLNETLSSAGVLPPGEHVHVMSLHVVQNTKHLECGGTVDPPMSSVNTAKHAPWSGAQSRVDSPNIDPKVGSVDRRFCTIRKMDVTATLHASRGTQGHPEHTRVGSADPMWWP